jgi:hypothetical protein
VGAVLCEGIGHGFEVNGKSFQVNDAQVSGVGFPDLSLFESHSGVRMVGRPVGRWCRLLAGSRALHRAGRIFVAIELLIGERKVVPGAAEARLECDGFFEEADCLLQVVGFCG